MTATATNAVLANTPAMGDNGKAPKSFEVIAFDNAVKAIGDSESAIYKAAIALGVYMAERQAAAETFDPKENKAYWTGLLFKLAYNGVMVWRHTKHEIDAIANVRSREARIAIAREYVGRKGRFDDKKNENKDSAGNLFKPRLTDGLARLKTVSFKLMEDIHTNHAGLLREVKAMRGDDIAGEAIVAHVNRYVADKFGGSFAELSDTLRGPQAAPKTKAEKIAAFVKRFTELDPETMVEVMGQLQGVYDKIQSALNEGFEGDAMLEGGETETETVETEAAPVAAAA